jgi:putative ABC transport system permease protein
VPLKVVHRVVSNATELSYFDLNGKDGIDSIQLSQEIADYLNDTYYAKNENFYIEKITMQEQAQMLNQEIGMIKLVMGGIGAISLLVGGIGVMNIMIVSITERTREIGTRKALGATNGSIRLQFITEAIVLCVIGGLLGLGFGMLLGHVITNAIGYPGTVTAQNVVAVLLFSTAFGIFFGYYPANRAAKMNPIDALRYE